MSNTGDAGKETVATESDARTSSGTGSPGSKERREKRDEMPEKQSDETDGSGTENAPRPDRSGNELKAAETASSDAGAVEPSVLADEVVRFTTAATPAPSERVIRVPRGESELVSKLRTVEERTRMGAIATRFGQSGAFVDDVNDLGTPIAAFQTALESDDAETISEVERTVQEVFDAMPAEIVDETTHQRARRRLEDTFVALAVSPELGSRAVDQRTVADAIRLFEVIETAAGRGSQPELTDVVSAGMERPVALVDDLFASTDSGSSPTESEGETEPSTGNASGDIESAVEELRSVSRSIDQLNRVAFDREAVADVEPARDDDSSDGDSSDDGSTGFRERVTRARQHRTVDTADASRRRRGNRNDANADDDDDRALEVTVDDAQVLDRSRLTIGDLETDLELSDAVKTQIETVEPEIDDARIGSTVETLKRRERALATDVLEEGVGSLTTEMVQVGDTFYPISERAQEFSFRETDVPDGATQSLFPAGSDTLSSPFVDVLGVSDLNLVRQNLERYELGEISHIENVLQGESKERTHRRKRRTEHETESESETVEEGEDHLETTDRYELQRETVETVREQSSLASGYESSGTARIMVGIGPKVETESYVDASSASSSELRDRTAQQFARDVVQRSVNRIKTKIRERERSRIVQETEETNAHGIDNADGSGHVTGIYRWVEKIYREQVYNYGNRVMLELTVPEPAAFYRHALTSNDEVDVTVEKPRKPFFIDYDAQEIRELRPEDLDRSNYQWYATEYGVSDVSPPPEEYQVRGDSLKREHDEVPDTDERTYDQFSLTSPDGYRPERVEVRTNPFSARSDEYVDDLYDVDGERGYELQVTVGTGRHTVSSVFSQTRSFRGTIDVPEVQQNADELPVTVSRRYTHEFALHLLLVSRRSDSLVAEWQLETYDAIVRAYERKKSAYEDAVAAAEYEGVIDTFGDAPNPGRTSEIVTDELKRGSITLLQGSEIDEDPIADGPNGYPGVDFSGLAGATDTIQFFEDAFEWEHMRYEFHPYYWTDRDRWVSLQDADDTDPEFARFLRAGVATVTLPVKPGYNRDVLNYLQSNGDEYTFDPDADEIWHPELVGTLEEIEELEADDDSWEAETPVGEPWLVSVPTSLVKLQETAELPTLDSETGPGENGD
ncbi:hypothetical protein [Natrarchaeobius chitinivorans]|uniref:Uncharacterized protein n=1 Tax=Natrarchaeobius chitinivorans TaxID=1679083 RepID=A0A3N6P7L0_NATCH|nr:hypothetical protein [Natrarchaeobius chitinivorans]RQG94449.1 hypothetical protein EA473_12190 [Natrarchaeobius chitinivorans]